MSLRERLQEDMKAAMRARESERLTTIRMLQAAIKQREVDERRTLEEAEILSIVEKLIKQRKDSATQFRAGQRPDLADKEEAEIVMLTAYLPEPLSMEALDALIAESISQLEAAGPKDMGKVLNALRPQLLGKADMALVADKVKARLNNG
ncbi:GatB/YqeY domain-containing protein [Acidithiobacillus montserratensis]|uniref:GatB/YqeY domain-containing protein n=1 Tax=Acidithiobacillus montserratensis TaxID=2729135 RepID=A0ACD5HE46_9PROT|nr:GatB/YqeY domain-containing protein [Acidithiobacillus montserratensis]MBU2747347.1 GatB/YqeY domain-containing protein [Acidithiobacillus montserratensis]